MTAIVFSNKETSSLVWRRCGYHARAVWLSKVRAKAEEASEGEGIHRRRRWGAKPSQAVLLSSALTSFSKQEQSSIIP